MCGDHCGGSMILQGAGRGTYSLVKVEEYGNRVNPRGQVSDRHAVPTHQAALLARDLHTRKADAATPYPPEMLGSWNARTHLLAPKAFLPMRTQSLGIISTVWADALFPPGIIALPADVVADPRAAKMVVAILALHTVGGHSKGPACGATWITGGDATPQWVH